MVKFSFTADIWSMKFNTEESQFTNYLIMLLKMVWVWILNKRMGNIKEEWKEEEGNADLIKETGIVINF